MTKKQKRAVPIKKNWRQKFFLASIILVGLGLLYFGYQAYIVLSVVYFWTIGSMFVDLMTPVSSLLFKAAHYRSESPFYWLGLFVAGSLASLIPALIISGIFYRFSSFSKKKIIAIILFLFLFIQAFDVFRNSEIELLAYPEIDTTYSESFSIEEWNSIQNGMTKDEVTNLLGKPLHEFPVEYSTGIPNCHDRYIYSSDGKAMPHLDFAYVDRQICFDNEGKVSLKTEYTYKN